MSSNIIIARMISPSQILFKCHQVDDQIICSQTLLTEKSLFFKNIFASPLESGRNEFEIRDISYDNLARVVNFISTSVINMDGDNLLELLSVAVYLAVPSLEVLCKQYLISHADPQDYCMIFKFANWNRLPEFSSQILKLIHKHAAEVLAERSFVECDVNEMILIIESDDLEVENEESCWHTIREWYAHDADNRQADFIRLLELVRFPLMQESVLAKVATYCQEQEFTRITVTPFLKKALEMLKDPHRAFEISHPKYHLRNNGFQHGLIVFNDSEITEIEFGSDEGPDGGTYDWRPDIVNDMVGLFDPVSQQTKWLHEIPKNVKPTFACQSSVGDLFISTSSYNPGVPQERVLKYSIEKDSWDVIIETGLGYIKGLCLLEHFLYIFYMGRNLRSPTLMTRRNISISVALEMKVPDPDGVLPFHFTSGTKCVVQGSCIYVLGCRTYGTPDADSRQVFCFEPETYTWRRKSDCPVNLSRCSRVCTLLHNLIYIMTNSPNAGSWLSHVWSYDTTDDFWNIFPVLTMDIISCQWGSYRGIYAWNNKLLIKDRFFRCDIKRDHKPLSEIPATLLVCCPHKTILLFCRKCRGSTSVVAVFDPATKKILTSWVLGSREAGELSCGTAFRIRKSALRERKDDVRAVKIGNEPGVPITLEEQKEELRIDPPNMEAYLFNGQFYRRM